MSVRPLVACRGDTVSEAGLPLNRPKHISSSIHESVPTARNPRPRVRARFVMTKYLVLSFLLTTIAGTSVAGFEAVLPHFDANVVRVGLAVDDSGSPPTDAAADPSKSCAGVSFTRKLKYGESDLNVLDIATGDSGETTPRPVLLFVAGESFAGENEASDAGSLEDAAMCFAARNKMVGVRMSYRLAPADPWPAGARDVAAATSWVHQNIDLFGGSRDEIVTIGYSVGAFHVASFLAHQEFQISDTDVAGAILVSGIYHPSAEASAAEKSYFGADASQYDERSAFPGILNIDTPLVLAWSALDPPRLVDQGEKLKERLCNSATHCPRITVLRNRESLSAVFGLDASDRSLAESTLELVSEIEARGLP
jgi:acetyl esterase/lipase